MKKKHNSFDPPVDEKKQVKAKSSGLESLNFACIGNFTVGRDGSIQQVNLSGANLTGAVRSLEIEGRSELYVSAESLPVFSTFLERVFSTYGEKNFFEISLQNDGYEPIAIQIEATRSEDGQGCQAVSMKILERKQSEDAKRVKLMKEITQRALMGSNLKDFLDFITRNIVDILDADGCYITWWDKDRQIPVPFSAYGSESVSFLDGQYSTEELFLWQSVINSGQTAVGKRMDEVPFGKYLCGNPSVSSDALVFVLSITNQNLGILLIKFHGSFSKYIKGDISKWGEVADQISLAISSIFFVEMEKLRRMEAELLQQATFAISSSLNLQEVLNHILIGLEQAVPFDSAAISLIEGDFMEIAALGGASRHTRKVGEKIGKDEGLFSLLENTSVPVVLDDAQDHPKYKQWSKKGSDPIRGWMGIPLIARNHRIGLLMLNSRERNFFTTGHARLAQAFANQAAGAIENARLFEQVLNGRERLKVLSKKLLEVQERERRLISHELHDEIGQELTGLQFVLLLGQEGNEEERLSAIQEGQGLVSGLIAQVRELSLNLHPAMLEELGLLHALNTLFVRYQFQTGIQVNFKNKNVTRRFSGEVELSCFRVIQEALTNAARYAGVMELDVDMSVSDVSLSISIEDHGKGFNMDILKDGERSFGLTGIRERTYLVGGVLTIYSEIGKGTRIEAFFPITKKLERRRNDRSGDVG